MASSDPLASLGLGRNATADEIRAARRRLAQSHHPDLGGDPARMQSINEAADAALLALDATDPADETAGQSGPAADRADRAGQADVDPAQSDEREFGGLSRDVPSFTIEALPVESFEAMLVVASWLGEVLDDDPPYRLDTYLTEPFDCWCRLEVVPDAGSSTVSLSIAGLDGAPTPDILAVRDAWVSNLNLVDWP